MNHRRTSNSPSSSKILNSLDLANNPTPQALSFLLRHPMPSTRSHSSPHHLATFRVLLHRLLPISYLSSKHSSKLLTRLSFLSPRHSTMQESIRSTFASSSPRWNRPRSTSSSSLCRTKLPKRINQSRKFTSKCSGS